MVRDAGGDKFVVYTGVKLQCCTPENYIIKVFNKEWWGY